MKRHPFKYILYHFFLIIGLAGLAQNSPGESRITSYLTYLYRIETYQAEEILKNGLEIVDGSYFNDLEYSFLTDSIPIESVSFGNYLKVFAIGNKLDMEFMSISNVEVRTLNNGRDLNLTIMDLDGKSAEKVAVKLNHKKLFYDPDTDVYRIKRNNAKGILRIEYEGVISFMGLDREIRFSKFRRSFNSVVYSIPLKYVTKPTLLVLKSPYDLFLSVKRRYPQGIFYYTSKPFADIVRSISWGEPEGFIRPIACLFDEYHCRDRQYEGFVVFNKPKYKPGDTVRIKAYLVNHKNKLHKKDLQIWIGKQSWFYKKDSKQIGTVSPYQPGFYETSFVLHDSLNLKLDYQYNVHLVQNHSSLINGPFELEDYELNNAEFEMRLSEEVLFSGDTLEVFLEGKDANGLNIKDARVELSVKPGVVHEITSDSIYVDNEVWKTSLPIEPSGDTKVTIPSDVLYDADIEYDVVATFQTSDFEVHTEVKGFRLKMLNKELQHELDGDSLKMSYKIGDSTLTQQAQLIGLNVENKAIDTLQITLPQSIKLNPLIKEYVLLADGKNQTIAIDNNHSNVEVFASRDADSLHVQLANPRKLNVRYFLYKGNHEIERGSGDQWKIDRKTFSSKDYFISIQYVWGGESYDKNYTISVPSAELTIRANVPSTVYPGKNLDIRIAVTDFKGKPVEDVDITSYGLKKQFERNGHPVLPDFSKEPTSRKLINNFNMDGIGMDDPTLRKNLDWQKWNALMTLDSISYFQLIYPENGYYLKAFEATDFITQFAPYVIDEGELIPIHIIYLDEKPIYFSMTEHEQFYSFQVKPGYHHLRLRTHNKEIKLDSVFISAGKKSIVGVDISNLPRRASVTSKISTLTYQEEVLANKYLSMVFNLDYNRYVKQGDNLFWSGKRENNPIIGPLDPNNYATYVSVDKFKQDFRYEPQYRYELSPGLIKMTSIDDLHFYFPSYVNQGLNDEVLTEDVIKELILDKENNKQAHYTYFNYPKKSMEGNGAIAFWNPYPQDLRIKNYILFKEQDPSYIRVYDGAQSIFHDLSADQYHVFALLFNNDFIEQRSLKVKPNSALYMRLDSAMVEQSDSVSNYINEVIRHAVKDVYYSDYSRYRDYSRIRSIYHTTRPGRTLSGNVIVGRITDDTGEGLPGVNILIKGTTVGTQTDLDGNYKISVPKGGELVFSYVGFETQEVAVGSRSMIDITMGGTTELQEVVVTGYAVTTSRQLSGMVAGVRISGMPGGAPKITIRGSNAISGANKTLYIIDGVPYFGDLNLAPDDIDKMEIIKGDQATSLYGSQAANGVILISLNKASKARRLIESQSVSMEAFPDISQANPLRRNFSDYAFWQPRIRTNKEGIAELNVTFPDDITTWKTHFLAIKSNKMSGASSAEIKSFKPILATLSMPRFMTVGDSSKVSGRVLNYTRDTLRVDSKFSFNGEDHLKNVEVISSYLDSLIVTPTSTDSLELKYSIITSSGYEDGELRSIPVYPIGVNESKGVFKVLNTNKSFTIPADSLSGEATLYVKGNLLPVFLEELEHVRNYAHACNEQKASKLLALVYERRIRSVMGEEFEFDHLIQRYIRQLNQSKNEDQTWGWWPQGKTVNWITRHVVKSLYEAKKDGFEVKYNAELIINELVADLAYPNKTDIGSLELLMMLGAQIDYEEVINGLDTLHLDFEDQIRITHLKQLVGMDYDIDFLLDRKQETMLGGMYWESDDFFAYKNEVLLTVRAFKVLDLKGGHETEKQGIINYLLNNRKNGYWRNTYESIRILEAIMPEIMAHADKLTDSRVLVSGDESFQIDTFPSSRTINIKDHVTLTNAGAGPVFITAYQTFFNPTPQKVDKDFKVTTRLDSIELEKGEQTIMSVEITNDKDGEYVMVEIPIPAGATYADKPKARNREVHREYYRNRLCVFYEKLPAGTYTVDIPLLPRYSGSYTINPAKAELMYFPTFYGREEIKKVVIE